jgi:hypothetical protein
MVLFCKKCKVWWSESEYVQGRCLRCGGTLYSEYSRKQLVGGVVNAKKINQEATD